MSTLTEILVAIANVLSGASKPTKIRLALPTITRKGIVMANFELNNDGIYSIPILVDNAGGTPVSPQAGDTFSAVSSLPGSLGVSVSGSVLIVTPLVALHENPAAPAAPDLFVTVSDSAGNSSYIQVFDIVADQTPKAISLNLAGASVAPQPVPTNLGP